MLRSPAISAYSMAVAPEISFWNRFKRPDTTPSPFAQAALVEACHALAARDCSGNSLKDLLEESPSAVAWRASSAM
jgi:hypothetical protein